MEVANGGIESVGGERTGGIEAQQCVEIGEQGVKPVERWATVAITERECFALLDDEVTEDGEILCGGLAFESPDGINRGGCGQGSKAMGKNIGGRLDGGRVGGVFPGCAAEEVSGVGDLAGNEGAGEGSTGGGIVGPAVLLATEEYVAAGCANDIGEMPAIFCEEGNCDAGLGAGAEKEWAADYITETDETAKIEQWQAQTDFFLHLDDDSLSFFAQIGALGGYIESVEESAHRG